MKTCTLCGQAKPVAAFSRSSIASDGFHTWCKACKAARAREWYASNAEAIRTRERERHAIDPTANRAKSLKAYRKKCANDPSGIHRSRRNWKLRRYGLTVEDYEAMLAAQGGRCAICREAPDSRRRHDLAVDHCHETELVRGLLCHRCNVGLGHFNDRPNLLRAAAEYLDRTAKKRSA